MSLLGYTKVIPYTKFEHFEIIRFWVTLQLLVWKNVTVTLTFDLSAQNHVISCTEFEQF